MRQKPMRIAWKVRGNTINLDALHLSCSRCRPCNCFHMWRSKTGTLSKGCTLAPKHRLKKGAEFLFKGVGIKIEPFFEEVTTENGESFEFFWGLKSQLWKQSPLWHRSNGQNGPPKKSFPLRKGFPAKNWKEWPNEVRNHFFCRWALCFLATNGIRSPCFFFLRVCFFVWWAACMTHPPLPTKNKDLKWSK